jgi:uncharacterized cupredoxin-like copper-binding protein
MAAGFEAQRVAPSVDGLRLGSPPAGEPVVGTDAKRASSNGDFFRDPRGSEEMRPKSLVIAAIVILAALVGAGCGGADDNGDDEQAAGSSPTATQTTTQAPAAERALTIRMTEFAFDPKDAIAKAGRVTITAPNDGNVVHELVLLRTEEDPAALPKKAGKVDESTSVGEIADVEPRSTKKATFKLAPGKYAMVCALPGHYEGGMYGSLTVQ